MVSAKTAGWRRNPAAAEDVGENSLTLNQFLAARLLGGRGDPWIHCARIGLGFMQKGEKSLDFGGFLAAFGGVESSWALGFGRMNGESSFLGRIEFTIDRLAADPYQGRGRPDAGKC